MTVETSTTAPEAPESTEIDSELAEGLGTPEGEEGDPVAPEDDPNESFESWLKRQDESKKTETEKSGKSHSEAPKEGEKKAETPEKIKIKDKEYTAAEIEKDLAEGNSAKAEYNKIQQQAEQLVELLKTDPGRILDRLEVNKDIIEQWYYKKYIEPEIMTPEERQHRSDTEELNRRRAEDQKARAEAEVQQKEALRQQYQAEWSKRIGDALDVSGLPKTELIISRMVHHIKQGLSSGKPNVQPADVIDLVKQDLLDLQKTTMSAMSPDKLAAALGEETMAALRKHEAAKYKQTKFENKTVPKSKPRAASKPSKSTKKYASPYDILDDL